MSRLVVPGSARYSIESPYNPSRGTWSSHSTQSMPVGQASAFDVPSGPLTSSAETLPLDARAREWSSRISLRGGASAACAG